MRNNYFNGFNDGMIIGKGLVLRGYGEGLF
jgi:hypothetical protein